MLYGKMSYENKGWALEKEQEKKSHIQRQALIRENESELPNTYSLNTFSDILKALPTIGGLGQMSNFKGFISHSNDYIQFSLDSEQLVISA